MNMMMMITFFQLFGIGSLLLLCSTTTAAAPAYAANYCPTNQTFNSSTTFQTNLRVLLSAIISNSSQSNSYYASAMGRGTPNAVEGDLLCRGDVSPAACEECAAAAAAEITRRCPNKTESIAWYDECTLGYTYRYYSVTGDIPKATLADGGNISAAEFDSFNRTVFGLLSRLGEEAGNSETANKFATGDEEFGGSSRRVFAAAQCVRDMTGAQCEECLRKAAATLPACCGGKQGARALLAKCNVRYQLYQFYNTTTETPSPSSGDNKSASWKYALIAVAVVILIIFFCCLCYVLLKKSRKRYRTLLRRNFGDESSNLGSLQFNLSTIQDATKKFSTENKIGEGGFGEVYKGTFLDGREIAVKKLSRMSGQGVMEFKNEITLIAKLQHRNLVTLLGFCLEEDEKMLIYEFVPNKSLDYFLFDVHKSRILNWFERYKIMEGIARGVLYLHEHSRLKVIHRDLKPSNILLDDNMNPKISDFGLARMVAIDQDRGNTKRIVGTYGYMSPEYAMHGQFSEKSDVFSFGVIVLEIISAKKNTRSLFANDDDDLLKCAWRQWRDQTPLKILDKDIKEPLNHSEIIKCIQIGLLCVQEKPDNRPSMEKVVLYLSSPLAELPFPGEPINSNQSGIVQNIVAGESSSRSALSTNEMSVSIFVPR